MLATILKSPKAVETTIAIVEAYAKLREPSRVITEIPQYEDDKAVQQSLLQRGGQLAAELLTDNLPIQSSETSEEQNLAMFKLKHTVKRENDDEIAQLKLFRASCRGTILPAARLSSLPRPAARTISFGQAVGTTFAKAVR